MPALIRRVSVTELTTNRLSVTPHVQTARFAWVYVRNRPRANASVAADDADDRRRIPHQTEPAAPTTTTTAAPVAPTPEVAPAQPLPPPTEQVTKPAEPPAAPTLPFKLYGKTYFDASYIRNEGDASIRRSRAASTSSASISASTSR